MEEDIETRYIWFCLLALSDQDGFIDITIPAIARRINVDKTHVEAAISKFLLPDSSSRTKDQEGRRLEKVRESFGWQIVNYKHYRDLRNDEERREYMKKYMRERRKSKSVNSCKQPLTMLAKAEAEAEAEAEVKKHPKIIFNPTTNKLENLNGNIEIFKSKFPKVDFETELLKMESWLYSHPKSRKKNYESFISSWLSRAEPEKKERGVEL
jgi:hypothetical protein